MWLLRLQETFKLQDPLLLQCGTTVIAPVSLRWWPQLGDYTWQFHWWTGARHIPGSLILFTKPIANTLPLHPSPATSVATFGPVPGDFITRPPTFHHTCYKLPGMVFLPFQLCEQVNRSSYLSGWHIPGQRVCLPNNVQRKFKEKIFLNDYDFGPGFAVLWRLKMNPLKLQVIPEWLQPSPMWRFALCLNLGFCIIHV